MNNFTQNKNNSITAFMAVMLFLYASVNAQQRDSSTFLQPKDHYQPKRGRLIAIGVGGAYVASMSVLYSVWYKDYPQSKFHFFNDVKEWNQMDKFGHVGSSYYLGRWSTEMVRWTGTDNRKSAIIGTGMGYLFQTTIEVLDGFSSQWGFSVGDVIANTTGSALFLSQELLWNEQRITYKFSYHESELAQYRPNILGATLPERILKDYNGQTYWLSANIYSFLPKESKFPKWFNIALGYGADGMIGAESNDVSYKGIAVPPYERVRQFYLAADVDLSKIKTKSKTLKTLFQLFGFVKFPSPTFEYRSNGRSLLHGFYF